MDLLTGEKRYSIPKLTGLLKIKFFLGLESMDQKKTVSELTQSLICLGASPKKNYYGSNISSMWVIGS